MKIQILNKPKKKKIIEHLEKQYGIKKIPHLLIQTGKQKIRGYSGNLSTNEILKIAKYTNIENIGLYLFKFYNEEIRLTIDACHIFKNQINKNIIKLNDKQAEKWFKGKDIELNKEQLKENKEKGFKILKHEDNLIGCGKLSQGIIKNFVPKERRIKN